jgi:flagellar biosynthesis/type III secretory pathway M-ring protein FliF/YscJ
LRDGIEVKQAKLGELKDLRVEAAPVSTPLWLYAVVTIIAIIIVAGVVIAMRRKATKVAPPAPPASSKA